MLVVTELIVSRTECILAKVVLINISNTNRRLGMLVIWPLSNPQWSLCTFHIFLTLYCFLDPSTTHNCSKVTVFKKIRKNTMKYNSTKLRDRLSLMRRTRKPTRKRIPNPMATMYYAELFTLHRLRLRSLLSIST